jgi:hypothetical protein
MTSSLGLHADFASVKHLTFRSIKDRHCTLQLFTLALAQLRIEILSTFLFLSPYSELAFCSPLPTYNSLKLRT